METKFSLLWKDNIESENVINEEVFTDLKIEKYLSSQIENYDDVIDMLKVMTLMPDEENIKYRSDIFTDFLKDENDEFALLYYKLDNLYQRYKLFTNANKNIYRYLYFLVYVKYYFIFLKEIGQTLTKLKVTSKALLKVKDFASINNSNIEDKCNQLYNALMSKLSFSAKIREGSPYIEISKTEDNLYDTLINIANDLNIEIVKNPRLSPRKEIDSNYLYEIASNNKSLFDNIKDFHELYKDSYCYSLKEILKEYKFYLNFRSVFLNMKKRNIPYCKATIDKKTRLTEAYDVSLTASNISVVGNDYSFEDDSYMHFILGVNSGGKTCYLRSIGINYLLFSMIGYTFSKEAKMLPLKYIYTHFPNEENYKIGEGRLLDELSRIKQMKQNFSNETLVLFNETFSSTNEDKACELTKELLSSILETKTKAIFVTHQYKVFDQIKDEGVSFYTPTVSDDSKRTFKIKKVEKKLLSYAYDILYKHGLTKKQLESTRRKNNE